MRAIPTTLAVFAAVTQPASAENFAEIAQFAQSICGDIPEGKLTRTEIKGRVQANAGLLAKIVSGGGDLSADRINEIYKGIPLDKLPDKIPTVAMCKSELVKSILARRKQVANTCRLPDFGQQGWARNEQILHVSGPLAGAMIKVGGVIKWRRRFYKVGQ